MVQKGFAAWATEVEAFLCYAHQLFLFRRGMTTDDEHTACITEVPVIVERHIHVNDVALLKHILLLRYSVANDLIDTGAYALWETFVV